MNKTVYHSESPVTRRKRWLFNLFPVYRRTGGRVTFISSDWKFVRVCLKLKFTTRNYVGTVFGGSLYGAADPIYMLQLMHILGDDYIVWDKSATIKFIRPVKSKVTAEFIVSDELIHSIKDEIALNNEMDITLPVEWKDADGKVFAELSKTLYIANKRFYQSKRQQKR